MDDLFKREQAVLDQAKHNLKKTGDDFPCGREEYKCLLKEYERLLKQLRRITKISDRTTIDLNASRQALLDKVHFDALTGIFNRLYIEERLSQLMNTLSRSADGFLSVLMLDIDYFKRYNDTYGHGMGDICLKAVAGAIKESVSRSNDFAARYGGEEFLIVLPNTDREGAQFVGEKVLNNVRSCRIPHEKNEAADCVTISIGITSGVVRRKHSREEYINRADEALYLSKQNGRNQYTFLEFEERIE